ncbi:GDP-mannose 4,6-dehydratase [Candidatus Pacearchaeota archaeon]|jgi:GDPmannose 4,6-dehydratase|nr:GDP-mannose 4,6-dehydratase [Candidatus Pacearchaeota archaeon]|tara:strand:+ start:12330 stop:13376 length:1047 start_codon:yes stop_codon:yes gene_type:complete
MKTAMITGVTGQDGSYLAELLLEKGYRVIGLKRRTSLITTDRVNEIYGNPNFELRYYSLHDPTTLYRLLEEYEPSEFYNLAAQSHVRVSFDVPIETVDSIAMGTLRVFEAIRHVNKDIKIYQASSSEMYGDNPEYPQNETTRFMPASPYACAKLFAHNLCRNYREGYGMHISSGILFNHESPRRGETFVTRKITRAAARIKLGLQEKLYLGNLDSKRDWGFAGDYVEMMWLMLQQDTPDDYVIATGETHSVREWLEAVFNEASLPIDENVGIDHRLFRPHEVPLLLGDPSKAKEKLGWVPKMKFKQLAKLMYQEDRVEAERELRALGRDVKVQALIDGQKMPFREPKK